MKNFIDRAKFFFSKDKEFRSALYHIMGFYPHNIDLYRIAFAHKSQEYRSKKSGNKPLNNERLEFLGDAVLETVVSDIVYRRFHNKREGFLTNTRAKIVSRESLGRLAKELGIDRLIQSQTHSRSHNSYLAGNSFEALMGAIYLDRGFRYAFRFVEKRIIGAMLDLEGVAHKEVNFKSKLLEWSQKNRMRIEFKESQSGNNNGNTPNFFTEIIIEGLFVGEGKGFSKKESHQNASKDALTQMRRDAQFLDSIFRSKEKRTAMEADEFFVLPKIDEIESEINRGQHEKTERPKRQERKEKKTTPKGEKDKSKTEKAAGSKNTPKADTKAESKNGGKQERAETKGRHKNGDRETAAEAKEQRNAKKQAERQKAVADAERRQEESASTNEDEKASLKKAIEIVENLIAQSEPLTTKTDALQPDASPAPLSSVSAVASEVSDPTPAADLIIVDNLLPAAEPDVQTTLLPPKENAEQVEAVGETVAETASPSSGEVPVAPNAQSPLTTDDTPLAAAEQTENPTETPKAEEDDGETPDNANPQPEAESAPEEEEATTKKRRRRSGKRQSAKDYANTESIPAETSRRAEKAERKKQEELKRRAYEKARNDLAPEEQNLPPATEEGSEEKRNEGRKQRRNADRPSDNRDNGTNGSEERPQRRRNDKRTNRKAASNEPTEAERREREDLIAQAEAAAYNEN